MNLFLYFKIILSISNFTIMYRSYLLLLVLLYSVLSCSDKKKDITTEELFSKVLIQYGNDYFKNSKIHFWVNDLEYEMNHNDNIIFNSVTRVVDTIHYKATYTNGFIEYYINNQKLEDDQYLRKVLDLKLDAFLFLTSIPHTLTTNDVTLTKLEDTNIRKEIYYTLYAKILQEAPDIYDEFYLYINKETFQIEYQAEKHTLSGARPVFKRYYNHRTIDGINFSDYYTFGILRDTFSLDKMHILYEYANLKEIDNTVLDSINVTLE